MRWCVGLFGWKCTIAFSKIILNQLGKCIREPRILSCFGLGVRVTTAFLMGTFIGIERVIRIAEF